MVSHPAHKTTKLSKRSRRPGGERGSMNKWSLLKNLIGGVEVVIEVVDARDIPGTRLPLAEKWAGSRRLLLVANKTDLLPAGTALPHLENRGIYISCKAADETSRETARMDLFRSILVRTQVRPVKALLIGYPNVGKSSIINLLAHRKVARVSPVAGTTKDVQWVRIDDDLLVTDYRGIHPSAEKKEDLVRKGALNAQEDAERYAYAFAEKVLRVPALSRWLSLKYDIDLSSARNGEDVLTLIAQRRKWYLKGGEPNLAEAARSLLRAMWEAPEI